MIQTAHFISIVSSAAFHLFVLHSLLLVFCCDFFCEREKRKRRWLQLDLVRICWQFHGVPCQCYWTWIDQAFLCYMYCFAGLRAESSLLKEHMEAQAKELNHRQRRIEELEEKERVANESVSFIFIFIFSKFSN